MSEPTMTPAERAAYQQGAADERARIVAVARQYVALNGVARTEHQQGAAAFAHRIMRMAPIDPPDREDTDHA